MDITSVLLSLSGVILSFITIILLIRRRVQFGLSLLMGSIILALFSLFLTDVIKIGQAVAQATIYSFETQQFQFKTIELAILMTLISTGVALLLCSRGGRLGLWSFFMGMGLLGGSGCIYIILSGVARVRAKDRDVST